MKFNLRYLIIACAIVLGSCSKREGNTSLFQPQQSLGKVSRKINEASGLIASISNPGYLWTHNDGRNPAEIFLINEKGEIEMTCKFKNTVNRDWEDITIGSGPEAGINYLYVADIGDNSAVYPYKILYRIKEPLLSGKTMEVEHMDKLVFKLPDGIRDTESIMVDPISNQFYIISKREREVRLYEITFPHASDTLQAVYLGKLPFSDIVAADISPDGSEVLLKNYTEIYYWKRGSDESILKLLQREPVKLNYDPENQGEAIAWKRDGTGFYTLSESGLMSEEDLFFYKRK
jgi:hypothetical protein